MVNVVDMLTASRKPDATMNSVMNMMFGSTDLTMFSGLLTVLTMEKLLAPLVLVSVLRLACPPVLALVTCTSHWPKWSNVSWRILAYEIVRLRF